MVGEKYEKEFFGVISRMREFDVVFIVVEFRILD